LPRGGVRVPVSALIDYLTSSAIGIVKVVAS
jgi:hypothetical protein